jgi:hypothetical protein
VTPGLSRKVRMTASLAGPSSMLVGSSLKLLREHEWKLGEDPGEVIFT